jgi:outer membrane protein assembly factor BamA
VSFFGVGNDSSHDLRAGYFFDPAYLNAGIVFHATDWLRFIGGYEYLTFSTHITALNNIEFPDLADNRRLHFNGSVVGAVIDTRTSPGYSTRGTLLRATSYYYSETSDQPFEFRQTEYEAGQLVPLVSEQFVLAFRGLATFTNPDSGNSAPLALLPYIGSGSTLRGFENRRFVDRDRLVLTGEYRWRPSRYLDMAIFLDAGQVAHTTNEIAWNRLKTSYGIGARFHGPNFTALRVELAHSVEGLQFVITAGQPF